MVGGVFFQILCVMGTRQAWIVSREEWVYSAILQPVIILQFIYDSRFSRAGSVFRLIVRGFA